MAPVPESPEHISRKLDVGQRDLNRSPYRTLALAGGGVTAAPRRAPQAQARVSAPAI